MFDLALFAPSCILALLLIHQNIHESYRKVTFFILCEFILHEIAFNAGWVDSKILADSFLYTVYAVINLFAIFYMRKHLAHFFITALFLCNLTINCLVAISYYIKSINIFSLNVEFISFYYAFPSIAGTIMLLEIAFCGLILFYARSSVRKYGDDCGINHVDSNFLFRRRLDYRRSGWAVS